MMHFKNLLALMLFTCGLLSCQRDNPLASPNQNNSSNLAELELAVIGKTSANDLVMKQWFMLPDSSRMRVDELKLFLAELQFQNTAGYWIPSLYYKLIDFSKSHSAAKTMHGKGERFIVQLPPGTYQSIRFGNGLPAWVNKLDPTYYQANHDLSIYQGMYWDWNSGYRFFLLEGLQDTSISGAGFNAIPYAYHLGTDSLYQKLEFEFNEITLSSNQGGTVVPALNLELDINKIFYNVGDTIRPVNDPITHTSGNLPLALRVNHNLTHAWRVISE